MPFSKKEKVIPANYVRLIGSELRSSSKSKLLGPADAEEKVKLTIVLRRRPDGLSLPDFDYYVKTPLNKRKRLSKEEFATCYGASHTDADSVVKFARNHGLTVIEKHVGRRTVVVSGTVGQIDKVFAITLNRYEHRSNKSKTKGTETETYRGYVGFIHVPDDLADIIISVFGLDNRCVTFPNSQLSDPPNTNYLTVQDVTKLYNFPPGMTADGQTIAIFSNTGYLQSDINLSFPEEAIPNVQPIPVDADSDGAGGTSTFLVGTFDHSDSPTTFILSSFPQGLSESSLTATPMGVSCSFFSQLVHITDVDTNLNQVTISQPLSVVLNPGTTSIDTGTEMYFIPDSVGYEITDDIIIAASVAKNAKIAVYIAPNSLSGWNEAISRVMHPNDGDPECSVLSSSFYVLSSDALASLSGIGDNNISAISGYFQDAALLGKTVCVASGDYGSRGASENDWDFGDTTAHVQYPASDPWVLCVGGTTLGWTGAAEKPGVDWLTDPPAPPPRWVECVWNDFDSSTSLGTTGGGVSSIFGCPSYQANAHVPLSVNLSAFQGRGIPDVAANASGKSGFTGFYDNGGNNFHTAGTSSSTPFWAGLIAVLNANLGHNIGFINPTLYFLGSSVFCPIPFYPKTHIGGFIYPTDNSIYDPQAQVTIPGYPANPGWDACTGWGSPNGNVLLTALQNLMVQSCSFITAITSFDYGVVNAEIANPGSAAIFHSAFSVVFDGFTPADFGIIQATVDDPVSSPPAKPPIITVQPTMLNIAGISFELISVSPADLWLLPYPETIQRFTFGYNVVFTDTNVFPSEQDTTTSITVVAQDPDSSIASQASLTFNNVSEPHFAGGSATSWLSNDLRVFQVESSSGSDISTNADLATLYIQSIIQQYNSLPPQDHPFDAIPTDETASALTLSQFSSSGNLVNNFAVARVRYDSTTVNAQNIRVFFRIIPAMSNAMAYNQATNYRQWSDGIEYGQKISLWGADSADEAYSIPCFAQKRVESTMVSLTTQSDTHNVSTIPAVPIAGNEGYAYFGCWLDINQPDAQYPLNPGTNLDGPFQQPPSLLSVNNLMVSMHQCLVAEISYDPVPILPGFSPTFSGPLAQRNLSLTTTPATVATRGSRIIPNPFIIKPTTLIAANNAQHDELMINWGNIPIGTTASIYWPGVKAVELINAATIKYGKQQLEKADEHTLQIPVGGITYIPVPAGTGAILPGLISVFLPERELKEKFYNVVVHQLTHTKPENQHQAKKMQIIGSFQITIKVMPEAGLLAAEESALMIMHNIRQKRDRKSKWFPVLERYISQITERVKGLGGDPDRILKSHN